MPSVFVNKRGRDVIMEDMQRRIDRADIEQERRQAIEVRAFIEDSLPSSVP